MFKMMSMEQGGYGKLQNTPSCIVTCLFNATAEAEVHRWLGPTHGHWEMGMWWTCCI